LAKPGVTPEKKKTAYTKLDISCSSSDDETLYCRARDANLQDVAKQLMNADLHAAQLHVTESRCPSLVGISGIVLQETKNAFVLVTSNNQLKSKCQSDSYMFSHNLCQRHLPRANGVRDW